MERLTFNFGGKREVTGRGAATPEPASDAIRVRIPEPQAEQAEPQMASQRTDWAFIGLMTFTALLFFRPQDTFPPLQALHLAEISALIALAAMVSMRLRRGQMFTRFTPELFGVVALGAVIVLTAPFSIWTGGAIGTFTDLYMKVILIFILMINTLTTPKRVEQFTWLIVIATAYIAFRAVFDYARGVNLIENGRVQGAVGGMFRNPNDLALNMVAVIPLAAAMALRRIAITRRLFAAVCIALMLGAIVATGSRSGSVGLVFMAGILAIRMIRRRPGLVFAAVLAGVLALPLVPASYWERLASITDEQKDDTGSREARSILFRESWTAFMENPLTGVGAGQFKNYKPEQRVEAWRESHNVFLQVGADLGIFGFLAFCFLIVRALLAPAQARRLLKKVQLHPQERELIDTHTAAMSASFVGWLLCAFFASVAYHWTLYYLLALAIAPREYLAERLTVARAERRDALARTPVAAGAGA
jgi:O-antigen ligase